MTGSDDAVGPRRSDPGHPGAGVRFDNDVLSLDARTRDAASAARVSRSPSCRHEGGDIVERILYCTA
jgi:hypothetical protein